MKSKTWFFLCCAVAMALTAGCRSNRPPDMRYPDYSSRYTRQAREYEQMREQARKEEEARLRREEEARMEQAKKAERERVKLEKRQAEEREAREKEARKLAEKRAREEQRSRRVVTPPATAPAAAPVRTAPPAVRSEMPAVVPAAVSPAPARAAATLSPPATVTPPRAYRTTGGTSPYQLKPGDMVAIYLRGIPREEEIQDVIDENGYVTLTYINEVHASGKTTSELERAIRDTYLKAEIYKNISVNVVMQQQSYFVRGEVKSPGRYMLLSGMTLVQAIATAGGYTEFAQPKKVKLIRGDDSAIYDVKHIERNPEKDIAIEAEDVIVVPRSVF